ncbi:MAG: FAD-dependent oxidoreductase [Sphingobacterium sp.]|nr:FAD-dependent oxidoreductase [Sphingobacterium sp.]
MSAGYLKRSFDAVLITAGAGTPRDLDVPGRKLKGIHFALDFLTRQNRLNIGESIIKPKAISAKGLEVVVIGGGDTGSDCVGTSIRRGAKSVTQIELLPQASESRPEDNPWPNWPNTMRTSSSQDEGCERDWGILTKAFIGQGKVKKLSCVRIEWFRATPPDSNSRKFPAARLNSTRISSFWQPVSAHRTRSFDQGFRHRTDTRRSHRRGWILHDQRREACSPRATAFSARRSWSKQSSRVLPRRMGWTRISGEMEGPSRRGEVSYNPDRVEV